jgi:NADH-quinone oxidoreductase subunit C
MSQAILARLKERYEDGVVETSTERGDDIAVVKREILVPACRFLKEDADFAMNLFVDVTAVDWLDRRTPRFDVVYQLKSVTKRHRVTLKVVVAEDDAWVPSVTGVWRGADWFERELWDMFGVRIDGHPNLRRILMWEGFEGHPLRKDYPVAGRQPLLPLRKSEVHVFEQNPVDAHVVGLGVPRRSDGES